VSVGVSEGVGVIVSVIVAEGVTLTVSVIVGVTEGATVPVGVSEGIGVSLGVIVSDGIGVLVKVGNTASVGSSATGVGPASGAQAATVTINTVSVKKAKRLMFALYPSDVSAHQCTRVPATA
jgi:hypothetical protein